MERYLLVSGRVISFIFVIVGVALLVLMLSGILIVNATSVVPAFGQNLVDDHVLDDLRPAIWQSFTEAIPPEVTVRNTTIQTEPLVTALGRALQSILDSDVPLADWLEARAQALVAQVTENLRGRVTTTVAGGIDTLQSSLSGSAAEQLATILLATLDECTDAQVSQISQVLGTTPSNQLAVGISFLCQPPESLGVGAADLMRNALTLTLAQVGREIAGDIDGRLSNVALPELAIDTPVGKVTLEWPNLRIGSGFLSVTVPIPDNIVEPIEEALGVFSARVLAPVQQVQESAATQVVEARETLDTAGSQLATEATTRIPPTATNTPLPPTATATATLVPTLTPDQIQAERNAISPLEQRVLDVLNGLGDVLASLAGDITLILLAVFGLPLLLHSYLQLYLMRTVRLWLLWIAIVAAASGAILLLINGWLVTNIVDPVTLIDPSGLPVALAAVADGAVTALQDALQSQLNMPFTAVGVLLLVLGLVGIVVLGFQMWRSRRLAAGTAAS